MRRQELEKRLAYKVELLVRKIGKYTGIKQLLKLNEEIFLTLLDEKEPTSLEEIKRTLHLDSYEVSQTLDSLEKFSYKSKKLSLITRIKDQADKRKLGVVITNKGKEMLKENSVNRHRRLNILFDPCNKEDLETIDKILEKSLQHLKAKRKTAKEQ